MTFPGAAEIDALEARGRHVVPAARAIALEPGLERSAGSAAER